MDTALPTSILITPEPSFSPPSVPSSPTSPSSSCPYYTESDKQATLTYLQFPPETPAIHISVFHYYPHHEEETIVYIHDNTPRHQFRITRGTGVYLDLRSEGIGDGIGRMNEPEID